MIPIKACVRYGNESISHKNTHTMILSNHPKTEFGSAYILRFKEVLKNAKNLENQAFAMASAEDL